MNAISVQQVVEEAISKYLRHPIDIVGCGRTDTGVHASQYFLHFESDEVDDRFITSLNGLLPNEIAIYSIHKVEDTKHARFDASARSYEYHIHQRKDPFKIGRSVAIYQILNVAAMQQASEFLLTTDDFASFCKAGSDVKTTICDVRIAQWDTNGAYIVFRITADRFLRNMVRAIVGTLLEVGRNKMTVDEFKSVIDARDRSAAGSSASACGLYLTKVEYPFL